MYLKINNLTSKVPPPPQCRLGSTQPFAHPASWRNHDRFVVCRGECEQRIPAGPGDEFAATSDRLTCGSPASSAITAIIWSPTRSSGVPRCSHAHGRTRRKRSPGATRQRIGTSPVPARTSRASSVPASSPSPSRLSASTTRTSPPSVLNVVSSTLVRRLGDGCLQRSDGLAIAAPNDFLATDEEATLHMRVELRR